jgi:tungstate transport system permease protein
VGGNIEHVTRVLSSATLQETSRGNFALALALGGVLLAISLVVNLAAYLLAPKPMRRRHG